MPTLIRTDDHIEVPERLPVIALRDLVFFPYMVLPLLIGRPRSVAALTQARKADDLVLLVAQRDAGTEDATAADLFRVGTIARIVQVTYLPDGTARVVLEGMGRARIRKLNTRGEALNADVALLPVSETEGEKGSDPQLLDASRAVVDLYSEYATLHDRIPDELPGMLSVEGDKVRLSHLISGHMLLPSVEKQEILETTDPTCAFGILREMLVRELEILRLEAKLDRRIQEGAESAPSRTFGPGLRPIHRETAPEEVDEWAELERTVENTPLAPAALERAMQELGRLRRLNPVAPEAAVIRTYLDWILALPWASRSEDNLDVHHASEILDAEHYGLEEVKDRVLDHVAVMSLVREMRGPILCLVGPPGVGKTSLGKSVALALGRSFVRVSLGGVRDEAEIRGHRRTYVGALPGRVIQGMRRGGSCNPVFLLDEVDKMAHDFHGDPGAALLEVLDPEQNRTFTDHYLELEYDLSDVLFIATANTLQGIPEPLRDRMEVIRLAGYLDTEKREIASRFLWPRQASRHGLEIERTRITSGALNHVIDRYTREAGVRELDRRLSRVARKVARSEAERGSPWTEVGESDLRELLGPPPYQPPDRDQTGERIGIANGLAWTAAGGEVLDVEVAVLPGGGELRLTGTLGDVMKESAQAAVTYARSRSAILGLAPQFHESTDIHIHIPEGATPKDGPSAGITIAVALISALTDTPTRPDVALTGEITLRGRVLAVGGVKEKAVAALRSAVRRVILPAANASDLELLPKEVREGLEFVGVRTMDEVMAAALVRSPLRVAAQGAGMGAPATHG